MIVGQYLSLIKAEFSPPSQRSDPDLLAAVPAVGHILFDRAAETRLYAVLDPLKTLFLAERLEGQSGPFAPLYRRSNDEDLNELSPLILQLDPYNKITRSLFSLEQTDGPSAMLEKNYGLLLRSADDLDVLVNKLRRFTMIADQDGGRTYFRFWEPAMLFGALCESTAGRARDFFDRSGVSEILWTEKSLVDGIWTLIGLAPTPAIHSIAQEPLIFGPNERAGLRHQVNRRIAREMARQRSVEASQRARLAKIFTRLRDADHESEFAMDGFAALLAQIPQGHHAEIWAEVDQHNYGLAMINRMLADHYALKFQVPDAYDGML